MKLAILGDIHANLEALQAVLADIDAKDLTSIFSVGDIIGYGADPSACMKELRDRDIPAVLGNWENVIKNPDLVEGYNSRAQASLWWSLGATSDEEREYLKNLPLTVGCEGVLIMHSTPSNPIKYIMKPEDTKDVFAEVTEHVCFYGHTHVPLAFFDEEPVSYTNDHAFTIPDDTKAIINVGSVGQPRDGDPRAAYGLYDTESREVEIVRVEYDNKTAAEKIRKAGLPPVLADRLLVGK